MKSVVPNILSLLNLLCGCIGIVYAFNGSLETSAYFIWIGAFFDFLDGFAARILNATSSIGKDLDSLSDLVTFGVLPSLIMYQLIDARTDQMILPYLAFFIVIFSAIRLAKFNNDERQHDSFIGLPTPANAFFISSLPYISKNNLLGLDQLVGSYGLVTTCLVLSFLLVSNIHLLSLKFKDWSWVNNSLRYIFVIISLGTLILFKIASFPLIIIIYLIISSVGNVKSE